MGSVEWCVEGGVCVQCGRVCVCVCGHVCVCDCCKMSMW